MSVSISRTTWLGNGYGVEFIITDPFEIAFNVVTEQDRTMISDENICVGSDHCVRNGDEESLGHFAHRAHKAGISYAREAIIEHKETLDLSRILNTVVSAAE